MHITRHDVPVSGGALAAYEFGSAPDDAPLVITAHGITGNSHYWLGVARELGDGVRLVAADLRGRGDSRDLPGPFGQAAHAADLLALLDHLGVDRAVFAGHSLGAYDGHVEVLWGRHDRLVPVAHAEDVRAALPQAHITIQDHMGHHPQRECPDLLADFIERALTRAEGGRTS